jgi:acyl-CoA synthetase (AMP-forming)/AMP-acid ligase II
VAVAGEAPVLDALTERRAQGRMPGLAWVWEMEAGRLAPAPRRLGPGPAGGDDEPVPPGLAWILFTSGTTGRPKGVLLTHRGLLWAAEATRLERPVGPADVFATAFPLCHIAGYSVLVTHRAGRPVVLLDGFRPAAFVEAVAEHGVTMASLAPTMLDSLLEHLAERPGEREGLGRLRAVAYGSSGIPTPLLRRILDRLDIDMSQGYGMTEASGNIAFLGPEDHRRGAAGDPGLLAACGRPSPLIAVAVLDDDDRPRPDGEVGEIGLRGPSVTPGYWRDPAATAAAWRRGWFHTGDIGVFGPGRLLRIVDRAKDLVITGGENVSSREVEEALHHLPGVRAAAVVGVPDPHWGEAVCACLELAPGTGADTDAVRRALRGTLAGFKLPRHVLAAEALPRNATGKVDKPALRIWAAAQLAVPEAGNS